MPRRPVRLANCYVPLPLPLPALTVVDDQISPAASIVVLPRPDGRRKAHELRQLCLETSVLGRNQALGSSLVELGHTKILGEVHLVAGGSTGGGHDNDEGPDASGSLVSIVKFAPHIGVDGVAQRARAVSALDFTPLMSDGKFRQETSTKEAGLSRQLTAALTDVVPLQRFPKMTVVVKMTILQDDGSCLSAAITAATLALVDAKVELYDLVTSCTVAVVVRNKHGMEDNHDEDEEGEGDLLYLADPTEDEAEHAQAIICLAMTPNHKEVTLWSQSGRLSATMANQAMELCRDGCRTFHKLMREALISYTVTPTTTTHSREK